MIELSSAVATVGVDPLCGGRVYSLNVNGVELIVGPHDQQVLNGFDWGIYPMTPFAGRVRFGEFTFNGKNHQLPRRMPPHAIHGTVDDVEWKVISVSSNSVLMQTSLGSNWPFAGGVSHSLELSDESLRLVLELTAQEEMPAQVGWHPWFPRPSKIDAAFPAWMPRDADGMPMPPTADTLPDLSGDVDDCFVAGVEPPVVTVNGRKLTLRSDCSHWVVYTGAKHGVCIEPQSGPPNQVALAPTVLKPGETLRRWFEIAWA